MAANSTYDPQGLNSDQNECSLKTGDDLVEVHVYGARGGECQWLVQRDSPTTESQGGRDLGATLSPASHMEPGSPVSAKDASGDRVLTTSQGLHASSPSTVLLSWGIAQRSASPSGRNGCCSWAHRGLGGVPATTGVQNYRGWEGGRREEENGYRGTVD